MKHYRIGLFAVSTKYDLEFKENFVERIGLDVANKCGMRLIEATITPKKKIVKKLIFSGNKEITVFVEYGIVISGTEKQFETLKIILSGFGLGIKHFAGLRHFSV